MTNALTLGLILFCGYLAPLFPQAYHRAIRELYVARLHVAASREPCPTLAPSQSCAWRIEARAAGDWKACRGAILPSGAQLASHRYFKIIPNCTFAFGIPLILPPQVVYR